MPKYVVTIEETVTFEVIVEAEELAHAEFDANAKPEESYNMKRLGFEATHVHKL